MLIAFNDIPYDGVFTTPDCLAGNRYWRDGHTLYCHFLDLAGRPSTRFWIEPVYQVLTVDHSSSLRGVQHVQPYRPVGVT